MDKKYCIFDMDGTLVDSMGYWRRLGWDYLESKGFTGEKVDWVMSRIKPLTMLQSGQLFKDTFAMKESPEEIVAQMHAVMEGHYRHDVQLKDGIRGYLDKLKARGCLMCVATATEQSLSLACLERLGIGEYFEFLLSGENLGMRKSEPDIYLLAGEKLGGAPGETAVFEDALYAARTAKDAGFYTVAVQDIGRGSQWEELLTFADEAVTDWNKAD